MDIPKELRESGLKATLPRLRILQLFHESKTKHLSAEDVYRIGAVLKHERYADKAPGAKLMSSVFALHSGLPASQVDRTPGLMVRRLPLK